MVFDRFARALPVLAIAVALAGCVTVAPVASPTTPPTAAPTASPAPTAPPTASPTAPPTTPPTAPPTAPPTDSPTTPPTDSPTTPPTAPPTGTVTAPPTSPPTDTQLDPNQTARYGSPEVSSGFSPDPMELSAVSGGPIDANYLGGGCTGYAEPNPDYEVHYTAGLLSRLRFYFVADSAGEDATLIINDTAGHWQCNDDSYGTSNPMIEFTPPVSGYYDIWIGSYSADAFISGTLYITELDSNHP